MLANSAFSNIAPYRLLNRSSSKTVHASPERAPTTRQLRPAPRGYADGDLEAQEELASRPVVDAEVPIVFVIDDDESMRRGLTNVFGSVGLRIEAFGSAPELLQRKLPHVPSCIVLDIRLPGMSGLDLQDLLQKAAIHTPIVFMTGHGDIPMSVKAMKAGAVDFLTKPFRQQEMLDAVMAAIERDRKRREDEKIVSNLQALFETLTPRERDILALVSAGLMNKQIAGELGIAEITVKIHRGNVKRKMGAKSLVDLLRATEILGIHRAKP
jgi:FixJ family two-component response regulator